jgi:drug/metabolite transporter (DMT)-like permease
LRANVWAALALFLGPIGWSGGSILSQKMGRDAVFRGEALPSGPMTTAIQLICSGTVLIVLGFVRGEQLLFPIPFSVVLAWVYLVIMGSLIAFSAYVYTLQHARPALVSSYAFVNPIVAIVIGYLLLGEVVSIISMIAMMIVLLGIVFITLGKR